MPSLHLSQDMIDFFYPVGSYYETSNTSFDPNVKWGGTWVEDSAGRVPVSYDSTQTEFNSVGKTGGSKYLQEHKHTLTTGAKTNTWEAPNGVLAYQYQKATPSFIEEWCAKAGTGDSGNLQPYVVVKRWHRTA